jgi:hypothetical protein
MAQRQHRCDGRAVFSSYPDPYPVAHTLHQVGEPGARLRERVMPSSGNHQKTVELIHQLGRAAGFIFQSGFLRPPDSSLNGILMESPEDLLQAWPEVKFVEAVRVTFLQALISHWQQRPELNVSAVLTVTFRSQPFYKLRRNHVVQQGLETRQRTMPSRNGCPAGVLVRTSGS